MKKISVISLFMLSLFVACDKIEDDKTVDTRFFPANSIRCLNALIFNYVVDEEGNHIKIAPDTVYFESWTGNDTIIDGRECVTPDGLLNRARAGNPDALKELRRVYLCRIRSCHPLKNSDLCRREMGDGLLKTLPFASKYVF